MPSLRDCRAPSNLFRLPRKPILDKSDTLGIQQKQPSVLIKHAFCKAPRDRSHSCAVVHGAWMPFASYASSAAGG